MKFEDFIKLRKVRKAQVDNQLIKSLLITADSDLKFLFKLKINEISSRKIVSNYYDVLRSLLEALAAKDGYKVYSHEAFTLLLKEKGDELLSEKFDRFRQIRNKINYYGKTISVQAAKEYAEEIKELINNIKSKYFD